MGQKLDILHLPDEVSGLTANALGRLSMSRFFRCCTAAISFAFGAYFLLTAVSFAHAGKRIALVIGNSRYQNVRHLVNPANDARLIAKMLRADGFKLVGGGAQLNLDKAAFDRSVEKFGTAAEGADVALFYYAGHGLQINGQNYLVPVDADPQKEADVDFQMLGANVVLRELEDAHTKLNIVILDACRNNPFGGRGLRGLGGGLAQMQAPRGTVISFSTQPGNVALDGDGRDSPYSQALATVIRQPGLDIFRAFNQVGLMVSKATNGVQQPWVSASPITGDFYFAGAAKHKKRNVQQRIAFAKAARLDSIEGWKHFLSVYSTGYFADLARAERDKVVTQERARAAAEAQSRALVEQQQQELAAQKAAEKSAFEAASKADKLAALKRAREDASARKELKEMAEAAAKKAAQIAAKLAARQTAEKFAAEVLRYNAKKPGSADKRQQVAALTPATSEANPPAAPVLNLPDLVRLLKLHLRQVGCDPGDDTGLWDSQARKALANFNRYAGTQLNVKTPTLDDLDVVRAKNQRVCPLVCGRGTERKGDHCVAIRRSKHPSTHASKHIHSHSPIVKGSPEQFRLKTACKNGDLSSCRTLCRAGSWAWKACRQVQRISGLGGWGGGHHHGGQDRNSGKYIGNFK